MTTIKQFFAMSLLSVCLQPSVGFTQVVPPMQLPMPQPGDSQLQPGLPQQSPDSLPQVNKLPNEPRTGAYANLPAVTIREFRSSVQEVTARGATDMFMTALIKTHKFRVLERARMNEGIAQEKALNQQGITTGDIGHSRYAGAGFIFEGTVSESNANAESTSLGLSLGGMGAGKSTTKGIIGIDVRVVDIESGEVLDAINVRKEILGEETSAGGITTALANVLTHGRGNAVTDALAPSDTITSARQGSVDSALRLAIEEAVNEIAKNFGTERTQ
jgi:curli biogenesis system outer membrane secretion channel CsgG